MAPVKRILLAPLDWGLGHATRCIPLAQALLDCGQEVILAASGASVPLLKTEFPGLRILEIPGYNVRYSVNKNLAFEIATQLPRLFHVIRDENLQLKKIISEYGPDAVISDNRYGFRSRNLPSAFITHQLHLQFPKSLAMPGMLANKLHHTYISRFDECWIPDYKDDDGLAGSLSHPALEDARTFYLGPLSRFENRSQQKTEIRYDVTILLSGPEPQRTVFEDILLRQVTDGRRILLVRGLPGEEQRKTNHPCITEVAHMDAFHLREALLSSRIILSRSGYSGIMDFIALQKNAILVPTPGQTEQEYLARFYKNKKVFYSADQENFQLEDALAQSKDYSVKNISLSKKPDLKAHVSEWLNRISSY